MTGDLICSNIGANLIEDDRNTALYLETLAVAQDCWKPVCRDIVVMA